MRGQAASGVAWLALALAATGVSAAPALITNIAVRGNTVALTWAGSTNLQIVAVSTSLPAGGFSYTGSVVAGAAVTVTSAASLACFRLREVGVVAFDDPALTAAVAAALPWAHGPAGTLYDIDTESLTNLQAGAAGILTLAGIGQLGALRSVDLSGNVLTLVAALPPALECLACDNNPLAELDLSGCACLRALACNNTGLTTLDLSPCPALQEVSCRFSALTNLDLTGCPDLRYLDCSLNLLPALDLSACPQLVDLACDYNALAVLDLAGCTRLGSVSCSHCPGLAQLVVQSPACTNVACPNGALASLDLRQCPAVATIDCRANALATLTLAGCTGLTVLACSDNQLVDLDVWDCGQLEELYASGNQVSDISALGTLTHLRVIDLTGNPIGTLGPLISLAASGWLVGCQVYVSGPTIDPAEVEVLRSYLVDVSYNPFGP